MGHGGSFHDLALRGRALEPDMRTLQKPAPQASTEGPSFWDFIDVINPLQHIPIVNSLYRNLTGDTIAPMARTIGGALFGGPLGLVASVYENMVVQTSGKDFGAQIASLIGGDDDLAIDQLPERTTVVKNAAATEKAAPAVSADTASASPLDITVHPDDHMVLPAPVTLAQEAQATGTPPPTAPALAPASNSFMPLNEKVRRVPNNVKFRTIPGLSSTRIFNPNNSPDNTPKASDTSAPVNSADIDRALNKAVAAQQTPTAAASAPQATPPVNISDRMMHALEKYQTMQRMGQKPADSTAAPR